MSKGENKNKKITKNKKTKIRIKIPKIFLPLSIISYMLSVYFLLSDNGIFKYIKQRKQIEQIQSEIESVKKRINEIEERKMLIKSENKEYLENVFRRFGWVKEGERIIKANTELEDGVTEAKTQD